MVDLDDIQPLSKTEMSPLLERLDRPLLAAELPDLAAMLQVTSISIGCARPSDFEDWPDLPARIRGAWGRTLADERDSSTWRRNMGLSAFDLFFRLDPNRTSGLADIRPYVIAVEPAPRAMTVLLKLFGFAGAWADEAADSLFFALQAGLRLRSGGRTRTSLDPQAPEIARREGVEMPASTSWANLVFRSPLCIRHRDALVADAAAIFDSLANRLCGLARWNDLEAALDRSAIARSVAGLSYDTRNLYPVGWRRYSSRQPGQPIPMQGLLGSLSLEGDLDELAGLLAIGQILHVGSRAALGLGRYELSTLD